MDKDFPFIDIPEQYKNIIGQPDQNSRLYRAYGDRRVLVKWIEAVNEICGQESNVSPGGAASIVGVTRAAVHKRLKEGRLTGFCFYVVEDAEIFFLKFTRLEESGRPNICDIPVVECLAWAEDLDARRSKQEAIEEDKISKKDWDDDFMKAEKGWKEKISNKR